MIELKNIVKIYRPKKGPEVTALKDINLAFDKNGLVFILGKSGSGKTTLLNVVGGLDRYDSGDLLIEGRSSSGFKDAEFDTYRRNYVGFVFQDDNLINEINVEKNLALMLEIQKRPFEPDSIRKTLRLVELDGFEKRKPKELSGGQRQRAAIGRALIKTPKLILADEPTGNLDSATSKLIFELLKNLSRDILIIVVSHDREAAEKYGDRIVEIADGIIISDEKREENTDE